MSYIPYVEDEKKVVEIPAMYNFQIEAVETAIFRWNVDEMQNEITFSDPGVLEKLPGNTLSFKVISDMKKPTPIPKIILPADVECPDKDDQNRIFIRKANTKIDLQFYKEDLTIHAIIV